MNRKMTTDAVMQAWNTLNMAKYSKLSDQDKVKVWRISRALRPVAEQFDADSQDAAEKLKPTDDFDDRLRRAQDYEQLIKAPDLDAEKLPMGPAEYAQFITEFRAYDRLMADALHDIRQKEVEIDFEPISEETLGQLMASNTEWTLQQVNALDVIVDGSHSDK